MPRGPTITDIERVQILAPHRKCISYRKIVEMVNRSLGAVRGVIRQGFKPKAPKKWKCNQNISQTQQREMGLIAPQQEDSTRTIEFELILPIGSPRVQQILRAIPYLRYKNENGSADDPYSQR